MWSMMFWILSALLALVISATLLIGLTRGSREAMTGAESDMSVYRDQLEEVDRDLARGVLSEEEAETVRIEVSRRLLDADKRLAASQGAKDGGQGIAMVLVPVVLLFGSAALYTWIGAPGYRDMPMEPRLAAIAEANANRPSQDEAENVAAPSLPQPDDIDPEFLNLMEQLRTALAERPDDIPGLILLARNEARLGNFTAARKAQERLIATKGDRAAPSDLARAVELMAFSAGGYISPEAEGYLRRLLSLAPSHEQGRYYLGLLYIQSQRPDLAFPVWRRLLEESPPDAPWSPYIRADITALAAAAGVNYTPPPVRGPDQDDIAAAADMSDADRQAMIEGMVEGLAARLAEDGGPPEDWAQLVRALMVLGDTDRARAIYSEARDIWGESEDAMLILDTLGAETGLDQ